MGFPPGFLDELRQRILLSETVGRKVRLVRKGREYTGLCPFHNEKTPSFWVNDEKGVYHCFGCGASGDAIEFTIRTEGLAFPDAVGRLAGLAGLRVPETSPEEREVAEQRNTIFEALEAAAAWFQRQLRESQGDAAKAYFKSRGVAGETAARFRLGYAPDKRAALHAHLQAAGFADAVLVDAGLVGRPEDGGTLYDRFRGRVIFPIADIRGRVIAFGARALGDQKPKYLNSPETPVFQKSRVLYGLAQSRKAAYDGADLIVAEGYMDVIALHQAGFHAAVAPLGTALTEDHLKLLWRYGAEPVLCFDGDDAGQRAAARAAERALPLLTPGHSLRFALLPKGEDPDSILKREGGGAFKVLLDTARPLVDQLWLMETQGRNFDTPERRAALEAANRRLVGRIADPTVRKHYDGAFFAKRRDLFRPPGLGPRPAAGAGVAGPGRFRARSQPDGAVPAGDGARARIDPVRTRERILLAVLINHPLLLEKLGEETGFLAFSDPLLDTLRQAVLNVATLHPDIDPEALRAHLQEREDLAAALDQVLDPALYRHASFARPEASEADAARGWRHTLMAQRQGAHDGDVRAEVETTARALGGENDLSEADWEKIQAQVATKHQEELSATLDEARIDDTGTNGATMDNTGMDGAKATRGNPNRANERP